ncbi:alpha/beta hydrolase [Candidatus Gracilibacteria bacterium]|nr:alpha/beta hydrolase [Candidatus Gracilibacteria bacterium]
MLPLIAGLTRRALLRRGVMMREVRVNDIGLNYYVLAGATSSAQVPVLLLHGIADSALTWALMLRALSAIGPVYALDLPGFGLSGLPAGRRYITLAEYVAVVEAFIRTVIGPAPLLVGNSLGGWMALQLALKMPQRARGVVALDPGGAMLNGRPSWEPFIETVSVRDLNTVRRIYRQMFGSVPLPLYFGQESFRALFLRDPVTQFVTAALEDDFFQPGELRHVQVPVGLVWGERDAFLPAGSFEFFRDELPEPELLVLPRCGHLPQQERPRAVARFVRDFAAKHL